MRKKFFKTFFEACSLSISHPLLYWNSFLLGLPLIAVYAFAYVSSFHPSWTESEAYTRSLVLLPLSGILSLWGKNQLVLLLDFISKKRAKKKNAAMLSFAKKFFSFFRLSFLFLFLSFSVILILSMPLSMFWANTKEISVTLFSMALVTYLPIYCILFMVEEFSFFYISLASLSFRAALENGARLFLRYSWISLLFCFSFLILFSVFTFFFNIGMLGIVALLQKKYAFVNEEAFLFFCALFFLLWLNIVKHAFYLIFFKELATPKDQSPTAKEEVVLESTVREFPPA